MHKRFQATMFGVLWCSMLALAQDHRKGVDVSVEQFGKNTAQPLLILLHGVGGPSAFYRDQASFFAGHGYFVVLPHYMDAGQGNTASDKNYQAWADAVRNTMKKFQKDRSATVIVGYSMGASVALALGSEGNGPDAIAEFYGSLPDKYFRDLKGMPPLLILHGARDTNIPVENALQLSKLCDQASLDCQMHIYPAEEHGFAPSTMKDADQRVLEFFAAKLH